MHRTLWFAVLACLIAGCGKDSNPATTPNANSGPAPETIGAVPNGQLTKLKIEDLKVGKGPEAQKGDSLTVTYTGTLANGTVFDSNDKPGANPFTFELGFGSVIKGWDQGMLGMKVGGERKLSIPPALGYGSQGSGKIPGNSDLYFDVKLTGLLKEADKDTVQIKDVKVGTGPGLKAGETAVVNYTCTLVDGSPVESFMDQKKPVTFKVGANQVLPALDQAIVGMKKGGERAIQIPPGFGPRNPSIPPNSVTKFDIILRDIKH
jgi:FKBP-type peptidyl-prolyl cis-trans isomerase